MIKITKLSGVILLVINCLSVSLFSQKINQVNSNGKRTGVWKKYYKSGKIRYEGQFKNGKETGTFKFYKNTSSTLPSIIKVFSPTSNQATVKFFTSKGKLKAEGKMIGKKRIGKWKYYFADGKTFSEENYNNEGKLDGVLKNYYPNGKVTIETHYKNGNKDGVSKTYTDDGILIEDVIYVNNKLHGPAKYFDLKGKIKEKGNYENGLRKGKWEFYIDGEIAKKPKSSFEDTKQEE